MNALRGMMLVVILGGLAPAAWAALPPRSPEELQSDANVVVTGKVKEVFHKKRSEKGFVRTYFVAEVVVDEVSKGEGPSPGQVLYMRYWVLKSSPEGWVGPSGLRGAPKRGDTIRAYLKRAADGGFDVLDPNGVSVVKSGTKAAN
ncbi:hypothetical protein Pan216_51580 [Planctomycetes bacterium Pan216]|uniref:Uncharacterized protein n=1 Tax=Kolteria novifilia TaxID=2527975 RepID=A0A518BBB8_9BACT|nr:hypothetical protein Pan216_51580 [Planctomycetes bacterium Pan216]